MRKISLLAAAAAICVAAPAFAKGGNNNNNGGGSGHSGSSGNSNGNGQGNGQGAGNGQGNTDSNGNSNGSGQGNGQGAGSGQGNSGQGAGSGDGGNGGGAGLGNGQSQGNSGGLGDGGSNTGNGGGNTTSQPIACGLNDLSLAALSCSGFYSGNLLDNNDVAAQVAALALVGYAWDGDFNKLVNDGQKIDGNGATEIGFGKELIGMTVIGIHFGGGGPNGVGNGTAFYRFDAGAGIDMLGLNYPGSSGIVLYSTSHPSLPNPPVPPGNDSGSVPEPSSWALMIGGFGMVGYSMRRRRGVVATA
jgi:hypothetical protein